MVIRNMTHSKMKETLEAWKNSDWKDEVIGDIEIINDIPVIRIVGFKDYRFAINPKTNKFESFYTFRDLLCDPVMYGFKEDIRQFYINGKINVKGSVIDLIRFGIITEDEKFGGKNCIKKSC